ncbi:Arsenate reductase [Burkholderia cenocepacia PC184]|nr:Arsenate reductase [Burkholderia cenocepacia PC184]
MIMIYHNPRCSKSRETHVLVESLNTAGAPLNVVEYLKTPPTVEELETTASATRPPGSRHAARRRGAVQDTEPCPCGPHRRSAYAAIVAHPILLQRPIVVYRGKAAIGRPPESVKALFE